MSTIIAERTETEVPINLTVNAGGGVTGLLVFVRVRDGVTLDSYLDFDDGVFKTAAHVQIEQTLVEVGLGRYTLVGGLDLTAITLPDTTRFLELEFRITGALDGVASDSVLLTSSFLGIPTIKGTPTPP